MSLLTIPEELKTYNNWVAWKWEQKKNSRDVLNWTKPPYDLKSNGTLHHAESDNPTTWASFEAAEAESSSFEPRFDGVGFVLPDGLGGVDFDGVIVDEKPEPYILEVLKHLGNPYTEITPSDNGLRAFFNAPILPSDKGRKFHGKKDGIDKYGAEIYFGSEPGRYLTVTGKRFSGVGVPTPPDIDLVHLLMSQIGNEKFKKLWTGDISHYGDDQSAADLALLSILARLLHNDAPRIEKYFGASILGQRDKWMQRADYRKRTIDKAFSGKTNRTGKTARPDLEFHTPAALDPDGEYVVAPVEGQEDGWFPLGDISLIGGASGTGKTTFMFEMLHKQKQGWPVLGHRTNGYTFQVLAYDRGKNAFTRTLRRLKLLATDIPTTPLPLASGTEAVQGIINEIEGMTPTPKVVFLEGLDMLLDDTNKKSIVTPFMRQLQQVGEHFHIALIGSVGAPKSKGGEGYAAKRDHLSGSEAWGRNCETVAVIEFSNDDDGTAPQRDLTILPRNASAEKFSLQFEAGRLVPVQPTAESEKNRGGRPNESLQTAIDFLERELQAGPKSGKELVHDALELENIKKSTLYAAAKKLHVIKQKPDGFVVWAVPPMNEVGDEVGSYEPHESEIDYGA